MSPYPDGDIVNGHHYDPHHDQWFPVQPQPREASRASTASTAKEWLIILAGGTGLVLFGAALIALSELEQAAPTPTSESPTAASGALPAGQGVGSSPLHTSLESYGYTCHAVPDGWRCDYPDFIPHSSDPAGILLMEKVGGTKISGGCDADQFTKETVAGWYGVTVAEVYDDVSCLHSPQ